MILNLIASIKPRNEFEAALAAQMIAVYVMTMKTSAAALRTSWGTDPHFAATAGKLARTYAILVDTLNRGRGGRRSPKQTIIVRQEKHVHHHQHVHMHRGEEEDRGQPHAKAADASVATLLGSDAAEGCLPGSGSERAAGLPDARRQRLRSAKGNR